MNVVDSYDYVVVGAGSSGCVIASRLSENSDCSVLLAEAGGTCVHPDVINPVRWTSLFPGPLDWGYLSQPMRHCHGRIDHVPRAKMLGGCHSHNAGVWVRGHRADFDGWEAAGCSGWGWNDVLPIYQRIENWQGAPNTLRGKNGPMYITPPQNPNPIAAAFAGSGSYARIPVNEDYNAESMDGTCFFNLTVRDGKRFSVVDAYLNPALGRDNLTVLTNVSVTGLVMNGTTCTGVRFLQDGKPRQIVCRREVILSAGVIGSPQILMLSGIGPSAELQALGIPPVIDLPGVGRNLQDHVLVAGINYECRTPLPEPRNNGAEATLWWYSRDGLDRPDIQPVILEFPFVTPDLASRLTSQNCYAIAPSIVQPRSRGSVRLASADPLAAPLIDVNFLADPSDVAAMLAAVELCRAIGASSAFDEFRSHELMPGNLSAGEMTDFIRRAATTYFHPTSTCSMGTGSDAVVSPQLQVHGIQNLRVADASIMPDITCGNTNAPCVMIAERAVDLLRI
ncbi:MAG: GMC family oxidoreductase N-terminal domain-containing protein [Planctomycetaceae bacterium]|nr:GMC family oxidoreductase N-terminal domain-containing protein [Planctomycetaceae bacterium]